MVPLERQADILEKSLERIKQEIQTSTDIKTGALPAQQFGLDIEKID